MSAWSATGAEISRPQRIALGIAGAAVFLLAWQVIGRYRLLGSSWPALDVVLAFLADPTKRGLFQRALSASLSSASIGFAIGLVSGAAFAALAQLVPWLQPGANHTTALIHAIPQVALAPVFVIVSGPDAAPAAISALNVFFVVYVAVSSGLAASTVAHRDLLTVLGASPWQRLWRLDLPAALPATVSGLKLAVPVALVGTLVGEWFGASRGLGVLILNAMENFQIPLLWAAVLLTLAVSMGLYAVMAWLERQVEARLA